ncbi:hypothetical protein LCGC14_1215240 [marine sediment metagenome]|uniref:Uncharacterized protein n=1 Tax=marine sediment metagenome TaxID=412755 RepID=A0A0F9PHG3_9ZZZZ
MRCQKINTKFEAAGRVKVAVTLMSMWSAPGYVPSSGVQIAFIVRASAGEHEDTIESIARKSGKRIKEDDLLDITKERSHSGVCTYEYTRGTIEIPANHVVVEVGSTDICTNNSIQSWVNILDKESLNKYYLELSDYYATLATEE